MATKDIGSISVWNLVETKQGLLVYTSCPIWAVTIGIDLRLIKFHPVHDVFAERTMLNSCQSVPTPANLDHLCWRFADYPLSSLRPKEVR
jgi:hypothetical protein